MRCPSLPHGMDLGGHYPWLPGRDYGCQRSPWETVLFISSWECSIHSGSSSPCTCQFGQCSLAWPWGDCMYVVWNFSVWDIGLITVIYFSTASGSLNLHCHTWASCRSTQIFHGCLAGCRSKPKVQLALQGPRMPESLLLGRAYNRA